MVILQPAVGVFINLALSDNYREQLILLPKRGSISVTNKPSYMVIVGMISRSGEESIICPELAATNQSQFPRVTFPAHDEKYSTLLWVGGEREREELGLV